jgi:hypothetical protein
MSIDEAGNPHMLPPREEPELTDAPPDEGGASCFGGWRRRAKGEE